MGQIFKWLGKIFQIFRVLFQMNRMAKKLAHLKAKQFEIQRQIIFLKSKGKETKSLEYQKLVFDDKILKIANKYVKIVRSGNVRTEH